MLSGCCEVSKGSESFWNTSRCWKLCHRCLSCSVVWGCWGGGWMLWWCYAAAVLPAPRLRQESSPSSRDADVFSCPNLTARCAAEFERYHPILEILTGVACCLYPAWFPSGIFVIVCGWQKQLNWAWAGFPVRIPGLWSGYSGVPLLLLQQHQWWLFLGFFLCLTDGGRASVV